VRSPADSGSLALPIVSLPSERLPIGALAGLLQAGVDVPARTGVSILAFLSGELGVDPGEVAARITTVFLDGDVVDALDRALLRDGSVLALSAAMPGLVGATLRRDSFYAAMRAGITRPLDAAAGGTAAGAGTIRLKLFNLLIEDLGPRLLAHGVVLDRGAAAAVLPREALDALPGTPERILLRVPLRPEVQPWS
jgi:hypothetical protein